MGLATQMIVWNEDFCEQLAAQGRWVVRFDNRDVGRSTKLAEAKTPSAAYIFMAQTLGRTPAAPYTLLDMAKDTIGLLDALGIERADIVGASMGGAIGQEMAIHFRERLRSLTLVMAPSGDPKSPPPTAAAFANLIRPRPTDRKGFVDGYVDIWRVLAANYFPFDETGTRREGEICYERGINPPGALRQMLAILASGNRKPGLRSVDTSTLVIHGTRDPLVRFAIGEDVARTIPGATFLPIEGMGHNLPREAWPTILDAIERHSPGTRAVQTA